MEKGYSQDMDMAFSPVGKDPKTLLDLSISVPMEKGYSQDMAFAPVSKDQFYLGSLRGRVRSHYISPNI